MIRLLIIYSIPGFILTEGGFWVRKRSWAVKNLKEFGFGKSLCVQSNVKEEISILLKDWESKIENSSGTIRVRDAFAIPIARTLWKLILGRVNLEDEQILLEMWAKGAE
jgi:hypothetical protein